MEFNSRQERYLQTYHTMEESQEHSLTEIKCMGVEES